MPGPAAHLLGVSADHSVPCWDPFATQPSGDTACLGPLGDRILSCDWQLAKALRLALVAQAGRASPRKALPLSIIVDPPFGAWDSQARGFHRAKAGGWVSLFLTN